MPSGRRTVLPHTKNNTEDFKRVDLTNAFSGLSCFVLTLTFFKLFIRKGNVGIEVTRTRVLWDLTLG